MLDTRFPRVPGDIGNAATFAFPVRYRAVRGASPRRVVVQRDLALLAPFIAAARELERDGATRSRRAAASWPCSSASWPSRCACRYGRRAFARRRHRCAPGRPIAARHRQRRRGVAHGRSSACRRRARGDTPIEGLALDSAFRTTLLDDLRSRCRRKPRRATVAAALRLVARRPDVAEIVSSAPTCLPTPTPCAPRRACRCTTSRR